MLDDTCTDTGISCIIIQFMRAYPHWLSFSMIVVRIKSLIFGMASKI